MSELRYRLHTLKEDFYVMSAVSFRPLLFGIAAIATAAALAGPTAATTRPPKHPKVIHEKTDSMQWGIGRGSKPRMYVRKAGGEQESGLPGHGGKHGKGAP